MKATEYLCWSAPATQQNSRCYVSLLSTIFTSVGNSSFAAVQAATTTSCAPRQILVFSATLGSSICVGLHGWRHVLISGSFDLQVLNAPGNVSWLAAFPDPGNPFTWTSALLTGISNAVPRTTSLHKTHVFITISACDCPVLGDRQRSPRVLAERFR